MKNIYDKILLLVAILILGASLAYYLTRAEKAPAVDTALLTAQPTGSAYSPIAVPELRIVELEWLDPKSQSDDGLQVYDIFTSPKIWWNTSEARFIFEPPTIPPPPPAYGLELVSIERQPYRIQMEAYFGEGGPDTIVQLHNYETGETIRGRMGRDYPEHNFSITDFRVDRVVEDVDGSTTIRQVPTVVIRDHILNQDVTLTAAERLYLEDSDIVTVRTRSPYPTQTHRWEEVGETLKIGDDVFTLIEFSHEAQTARVRKESPEIEEPETRTLRPVGSRPPSDTGTGQPQATPRPEATQSGTLQGFEGLFD